MSKFVLLVTLLLEVLLAGTRLIANTLKKKDRYGGEQDGYSSARCPGGIYPPSSGSRQLEFPGLDADKECVTPKVKDLRSEDV